LIPELDSTTGHLPVGRYGATLDEVCARFVTAPTFSGSVRRAGLWSGFETWLALWGRCMNDLEAPDLLRGLWVAGSFISDEPEPEDIDVTVFVDQELVDRCRGRGVRALRQLFGHRDKIRKEFGVEVFPVPWVPVASVLAQASQTAEQRSYLALRGAYDDLWQRRRPPGPKLAPRPEDCGAARGYLEVIL
jgi:hypothetical protein